MLTERDRNEFSDAIPGKSDAIDGCSEICVYEAI